MIFLLLGASCPWQIQAQPGQRINLTLYDFAAKQSKGDGFGCARKYAQVGQNNSIRPHKINVSHPYTLSNFIIISLEKKKILNLT